MSTLSRFLSPKLRLTTLILLTSLFLVIADNSFFLNATFNVIDNLNLASEYLKAAVFIALVALFSLFLSLVAGKYLFKPVVILILLLASVISFFMDTYGIIIDVSTIKNIIETDANEASELLGDDLIKHVFLFGIIPVLCLLRIEINYHSFFKELFIRLFSLLIIIGVLAGIIFFHYQDLSTINRNNKSLRYFINPNYPIYALFKYINNLGYGDNFNIAPIGKDAQQINSWKSRGKKTVLVLVIGETARAKNFSLNGYQRITNPLLSQQDVISFPNTYACSTVTEDSIPCMFSDFSQADYSYAKAKHYENLLDVLTHTKVNILWRDNNTGCKGVCDRVITENMAQLTMPEFCQNGECYDEILLQGLQDKINALTNNGVIILHQKGSHGVSYYRRYPSDFKKFTPECLVPQLQQCTQESIVNAYDNTILYTDYFLNKVIQLLQQNSENYNTAMIYISDHGESLGENGIYLHSFPRKVAPDEQTNIPFIIWLSEGFSNSANIDTECLKQNSSENYSHDNLFHSVIGMLDIQSLVYDAELDIFNHCRH